ncbi:hypothetical protein SPBR_02883 [Sporothrix brasiliensis 5110]|uniref:Uncharacterized protein n=1 Tax=Sporothrix brasiliensis 5110 TaxID=1398154 RepID=A0A0C2F014_9PEZI|nr:uncharacterized protein SPBR_02883 [Sporothrix brasiliensis 5110]KIH92124.1 hypothetical protein SPBR_02883 [Sporothrix brasiliensis 5110]
MFVTLCRFLGLLCLEAVPSVSTESVEAICDRSDEAWMAIFQKLLTDKRATCVSAWSSEDDIRNELHRIYLLWTVLKRARGDTNGSLQGGDTSRTANENLADLGDLLRIDTETAPLSVGASDAEVAKTLVCEALASMLDSDPELNRVYDDVPVGFMGKVDPVFASELNDVYNDVPVAVKKVDEMLPQDLLNNLPHETVSTCLSRCQLEYNAMPELLQRPDNVLSIFIYRWEKTQVYHKYMETWMASIEGKERYGHIKRRLREAESGDDIGLCLLTLVYYERVLDRTERMATPTHGSFLEDFIRHLDDDSGHVQQGGSTAGLFTRNQQRVRAKGSPCECYTIGVLEEKDVN